MISAISRYGKTFLLKNFDSPEEYDDRIPF